MKGVKYNYQIITPPNNEDIIIENASMKEVCENIIKVFKEQYYIPIKCNNQILYNLMSRPHTANKILCEKVKIERV
tara:strand:+ start:6254 stop:6481 length:228 start_codon:yes stop_codon:yes gene_type:complete